MRGRVRSEAYAECLPVSLQRQHDCAKCALSSTTVSSVLFALSATSRFDSRNEEDERSTFNLKLLEYRPGLLESE